MRSSQAAAAVILLLSACSAPTPEPASVALPSCAISRTADYGWSVFFAANSAALSDRQKQVLTDTVARYGKDNISLVDLYGNTDRLEARQSRDLGRRRAETAKSYIVSLGVPRDHVVTRSYEATRPLVPSDGGEAQNRNVQWQIVARNDEAERLQTVRRRECRIFLEEHCFAPTRLLQASASVCKAVLAAI